MITPQTSLEEVKRKSRTEIGVIATSNQAKQERASITNMRAEYLQDIDKSSD